MQWRRSWPFARKLVSVYYPSKIGLQILDISRIAFHSFSIEISDISLYSRSTSYKSEKRHRSQSYKLEQKRKANGLRKLVRKANDEISIYLAEILILLPHLPSYVGHGGRRPTIWGGVGGAKPPHGHRQGSGGRQPPSRKCSNILSINCT